MKPNMFEEFLMERHAEDYIGTKDTMIDDFNDWICELDPDQWLNFGEWYGNKKAKDEIEKHLKNLAKIKV